MREPTTADVFKMSRILKKMAITVEAETTEIVDGETKKIPKSQTQVGAEVILKIAENLHMAEKEVNGLMAGLVGITSKEFEDLPITRTIKYFEEFKNIPGIGGFFKIAGKLAK